jgi:hypothetical protein
MTDDPTFDLEALKIDPTDPTLVPARAGRSGGYKAQRYFVKVPWVWVQKLEGASGQTYRLALHILFLHFRARGGSLALSSKGAGLPRQSKHRALQDLESRGLVAVEWRQRRSPIVQVLVGQTVP